MVRRKRNLRYLDELDFDEKTKKEIKKWLKEWIKEFKVRSENVDYTVKKNNWKQVDGVFYFTDCRNIISNTKESKGYEDDVNIQRRKHNISYLLLLKTLISDKIKIDYNRCSHCDYYPKDIFSCKDGYGYCHFCPDCGMTSIITYPKGIHSSTNAVIDYINKWIDDKYDRRRKKNNKKKKG